MELVLQHCWSFTHPFWIKMFSIQYCASRFEWLVATLISLIPLGENTQYRKTFITRGRERYQLYSPVMLCCCFVLPQTSKEIIWVGSFCVRISSNLTLNWILFGKWSPFWSCFVSSSQVTPLQAVLHLMKIYGPFIAWQLGLMLSISFLCKSGLDNYTTTGPWFTDHVYSNGDIFLLKHDEEILVFQNGMCYGNYEQPIPCVTRDGDEQENVIQCMVCGWTRNWTLNQSKRLIYELNWFFWFVCGSVNPSPFQSLKNSYLADSSLGPPRCSAISSVNPCFLLFLNHSEPPKMHSSSSWFYSAQTPVCRPWTGQILWWTLVCQLIHAHSYMSP